MDFQIVVRPRVWKREMICSPSLSACEGGNGEEAKGVLGSEIVMFKALMKCRNRDTDESTWMMADWYILNSESTVYRLNSKESLKIKVLDLPRYIQY